MAVCDLIRSKIDDILLFLGPLMPLASSHVVSFITENHWDNTVPQDIKDEFSAKGFDNMVANFWKYIDNKSSVSNDSHSSSLIQYFINAEKMAVTSLPNLCLTLDDLQNKLSAMNCKELKDVKISRLMSEKKSYEVNILSQVVATIASVVNCSHIVDIGGGKAYLSSNLTLQHKLKVLSIDSSRVNTHGAAKRLEKLEKVWTMVKSKAENECEAKKGKNWKSKNKIVPKLSSLPAGTQQPMINPLFKQKTQFIRPDTNIASILEEAFPGDDFSHAGLVGLHTCGDLAASQLKIFVENLDTFKLLINIGCCYHLLEEEFCEDTFWNDIKSCIKDKSNPAFPMSFHLRKKEFFLNRNPRMLATQCPERVLFEKNLPTEPLFYRSLLQALLLKKSGGVDDFPQGIVGRLAVKCSSFNEYVHKAFKKLKVNFQVSDAEIDELYRTHYFHHDRIKLFFLLRVSLSPVLESLILLDRLLYLHEQGINDSFIAQIFDPVKSPRCYAIIAIRNPKHPAKS